MHRKSLLLILSVLVPVSVSLAGESIPLDKDFSFRLDQTSPAPSSSVPFPGVSSPSERSNPDTLKTPQGERLPSGTQKREFNGQPYYIVPLHA